jgi:hypothetical protein
VPYISGSSRCIFAEGFGIAIGSDFYRLIKIPATVQRNIYMVIITYHKIGYKTVKVSS